MVKQGILITPVLGEVLTNLAPLRMKHSASVPAYHKGNPTWLSLYLFACALTHLTMLTLCKGNYCLMMFRIYCCLAPFCAIPVITIFVDVPDNVYTFPAPSVFCAYLLTALADTST